jgi:Sulfotransferase family
VKKNNPIFILGNPRSGTTLLRLMLNAHPEICIPPECGFIEWWYDKYCNWKTDFNNNDEKLKSFIVDVLSSKKMETWNLNETIVKEIIKKENPSNYAELCACVYFTFSLHQNKKIKYWGDKNNYYIHKLPLMKKLYPSAKFIFIIRDGRDVAVSYRNVEQIETASEYKPKLPQQIEAISKEWVQNNEQVLSFLKDSSSDHIMLRYEDLVRQTKKQLCKICEFVGIEFNHSMLNYYRKNNQQGDEPLATLDWKKKTLEAPDESRVGQFHSKLSQKETIYFENTAGDLLKTFGYKLQYNGIPGNK